MHRLAPVDPQHLNAAQKEIYDRIASGPRKGVRGPLAIWLHRPELAACAQALGRYCRYDSCLEPRLSELAILLLGRHWLAEYEWAAHKPFALEAGLDPDVIEAIRLGEEPAFQRRDEQLVYRFVRKLHEQRQVGDDLYPGLRRRAGQRRGGRSGRHRRLLHADFHDHQGVRGSATRRRRPRIARHPCLRNLL